MPASAGPTFANDKVERVARLARWLVEEGITTIEEVLSVTTVHEMEADKVAAESRAAAANAQPALPRSLI